MFKILMKQLFSVEAYTDQIYVFKGLSQRYTGEFFNVSIFLSNVRRL